MRGEVVQSRLKNLSFDGLPVGSGCSGRQNSVRHLSEYVGAGAEEEVLEHLAGAGARHSEEIVTQPQVQTETRANPPDVVDVKRKVMRADTPVKDRRRDWQRDGSARQKPLRVNGRRKGIGRAQHQTIERRQSAALERVIPALERPDGAIVLPVVIAGAKTELLIFPRPEDVNRRLPQVERPGELNSKPGRRADRQEVRLDSAESRAQIIGQQQPRPKSVDAVLPGQINPLVLNLAIQYPVRG